MKAREAKLEVLNPVGEILAELTGENTDGQVRFELDGTVPGIQYRLTVER